MLEELEAHNSMDDYSVSSYQINGNELTTSLYRQSKSHLLATQLDLTLSFYQDGIVRVLIGEPNSDRFRISQYGISVEDEQLIPYDLSNSVADFKDHIVVTTSSSEEQF
jgi:hypothetical protein